MGLPIFYIKKEESHRTAHFLPIMSWFSPLETFQKWAVPWDCPISYIKKEQSHGTAQFLISKRSSPMGLLIFAHNYPIQPVSTPSKNGQSHGTAHFLISKRSSPMGLPTPHSFPFQPGVDTT